MFIIKHTRNTVFFDDLNKSWKIFPQCGYIQLFETTEEIDTYCNLNNIRDAVPFEVVRVSELTGDPHEISPDLYHPLKSDYPGWSVVQLIEFMVKGNGHRTVNTDRIIKKF